jgi:hypothetical protein
MKSLFSYFVLFLLTLNVAFTQSYEGNRKILQSNANYEDLLYIYYKGTNTELTEVIVTNYIKDFFESDYRNYRQNEFEWPAILTKYRNILTSKINTANISAVYTFQTTANLGSYNFENEGFDVNINMEYLFVTKRGLSIGDGTIYPDVASKGILLFINNNNNFIKMEKNKANAFINSRTKNGNVDRKITLHISFSISDFFPDTGIFLIAQMSNSISARITKIDVYDGNTKIGELGSKYSFPQSFIGTWKRDSFSNTITITSNTFKSSSQTRTRNLLGISGDDFTISSASGTGTFTFTIRLINDNLVISGDSGPDQDNWDGTWKLLK